MRLKQREKICLNQSIELPIIQLPVRLLPCFFNHGAIGGMLPMRLMVTLAMLTVMLVVVQMWTLIMIIV